MQSLIILYRETREYTLMNQKADSFPSADLTHSPKFKPFSGPNPNPNASAANGTVVHFLALPSYTVAKKLRKGLQTWKLLLRMNFTRGMT